MRLFSVMVVVLTLFLTGCKEEALLKDLNQTQANEVIALLEKNNIRTVKKDTGKTGYVVSVDKADFSTAVDLMTTYGLPSRARVDIAEMFPADSLISSPRAELARIYSAIEQRLEQTLNLMDGVVSSRVHVSYDINNIDAQKGGQPVHLSALIRVSEKGTAEASLINDAKRILVNSFSQVEYDRISVVLSHAPEQIIYTHSGKDASGEITRLLMPATVSAFLIAGIFVACFWWRKKKSANSGTGSAV